jgi:hypothetical protein
MAKIEPGWTSDEANTAPPTRDASEAVAVAKHRLLEQPDELDRLERFVAGHPVLSAAIAHGAGWAVGMNPKARRWALSLGRWALTRWVMRYVRGQLPGLKTPAHP